MGIFHGNRYLAINGKDQEASYVLMASLIPTGEFTMDGRDKTYLPVDDEFKGLKEYETEAEAVNAVKRHIINLTENQLIQEVCCMEYLQSANQLLQIDAKDKSLNNFDREFARTGIERNKEIIAEGKQKIAELRKYRRAKIEVRFS